MDPMGRCPPGWSLVVDEQLVVPYGLGVESPPKKQPLNVYIKGGVEARIS